MYVHANPFLLVNNRMYVTCVLIHNLMCKHFVSSCLYVIGNDSHEDWCNNVFMLALALHVSIVQECLCGAAYTLLVDHDN